MFVKTNDLMKKYRLTAVFSKQASDYADEHGVSETVKALENKKLYGMWRTYECDTEADPEQLKQALNDAWGWEEYTWEEE